MRVHFEKSNERFCPYRAKCDTLIMTQGDALGYGLTILLGPFQVDSNAK